MHIIIINGPNLNLLGKREPHIYGSVPFADFFKKLKSDFPKIKLEYFQSNTEGDLINKLHEVGFDFTFKNTNSIHHIIINRNIGQMCYINFSVFNMRMIGLFE